MTEPLDSGEAMLKRLRYPISKAMLIKQYGAVEVDWFGDKSAQLQYVLAHVPQSQFESYEALKSQALKAIPHYEPS